MSSSPPPENNNNNIESRDDVPSTSSLTNVHAPKNKHNLTPAEKQAQALSRLLANPDREVKIPKMASKEKTLRDPREMMKSVSGSSAGAGSGEFHVYKHARRREYERIALMEDKAKRQDEEAAFLLKKAQEEAESEAKTSKNKAKRDKKKAAKAAHLAAAKGDPKAEEKKRKADGDGILSREDAEGNKRRLVNDEKLGEALKFRKRDSDDEEEE